MFVTRRVGFVSAAIAIPRSASAIGSRRGSAALPKPLAMFRTLGVKPFRVSYRY